MGQPSSFQIFLTFLRLGLTAFGGPVAHIGYFHRRFVIEQCWLGESQFSYMLGLCQLLPGPASSQLGLLIGWHLAGWRGALGAFLGFTLPSACLMLAFAGGFNWFEQQGLMSWLHGLKLLAFVIVLDAVLGMAQRLCHDGFTRLIGCMALIMVLLIPSFWGQGLVIILAGWLGLRFTPSGMPVAMLSPSESPRALMAAPGLRLFVVLLILALLPLVSGTLSVFADFYRSGALVFGGGHVVLPLLEQVSQSHQLMTPSQFMAGYGVAQLLPGPLFSFAAYVGSFSGGTSPSIGLGLLCMLALFLPGFLLVLSVWPWWKALSANASLKQGINAMNAAVVGILAAALYSPLWQTTIFSLSDVLIVTLGLVLYRYCHWSMGRLALVCLVLGRLFG
ncbi:chromate efflux transporter [Pokkaliibacter sp. CJK22405]|uniref:chromate efflux transporter n=1 Tax=Pokkaliibacter sp. CJK22405 TaxID=3384615 RepID=UPI0039853C36